LVARSEFAPVRSRFRHITPNLRIIGMNRLEGLWTVEMENVSGWKLGGVLVLQRGRLLGGGEHFYCVGEYAAHGTKVTGRARCMHYNGPVMTAFGSTVSDFRVQFEVSHRGEILVGQIHLADRPEQRLPLRMTWRSDAGLAD
jgi:hypothetical protein